MYKFDDISVFFNSTGIIAQTATISIANTINQYSTLGARNSMPIPAGPLRSECSITYIPRILSDSLINTIVSENTKIDSSTAPSENISPIVLKIGNISGSFFFNSYRLSIDNNNIVSATVGFIGFGNLSGLGLADAQQSISGDSSNIGHAWSTSIVDSQGFVNDIPVMNLAYSITRDITPIYKISSKEPIQILSQKFTREVSFEVEDLYNVDFSGRVINDTLGQFEYIKLQGYTSVDNSSSQVGSSGSSGNSGASGYSGVSGITEIELSVRDTTITKISASANTNDIMRFRIEAEKSV